MDARVKDAWFGQTTPSGEGLKYCAFISYSHRDSAIAKWLHQSIEQYRVPRAIVGEEGDYGQVPRKLGHVFRDEEELAGASELGPQLEDALKSSGALIVIASKTSAHSRWVDHEIRYFKTHFPERPVLAVIADGVPNDPDNECFPPSLKYVVRPDGVLDMDHPSEPLAPDLTKLDRTTVKLKLIAGLIGVGYNDLANRDLRRARKRMAIFGTIGAVLLVVFMALSIAALTYARVANEQRKIAIANADEADRKAWLAQTAAEEIRRQADEMTKGGGPKCNCPTPAGVEATPLP